MLRNVQIKMIRADLDRLGALLTGKNNYRRGTNQHAGGRISGQFFDVFEHLQLLVDQLPTCLDETFGVLQLFVNEVKAVERVLLHRVNKRGRPIGKGGLRPPIAECIFRMDDLLKVVESQMMKPEEPDTLVEPSGPAPKVEGQIPMWPVPA